NLRQLGVATLNYESQRKVLPAGYLSGRNFANPGADSDALGPHQWTGVFVFLLPYLEADAVLNRLSTSLQLGVDSRSSSYWSNADAWYAAQYRLSIFNCPSVGSDLPEGSIYGKTYPQDTGTVYKLRSSGWKSSDVRLGLTNYRGVSGVY